MHLKQVLKRYRNDFHWLGECENCGETEQYGDGYADHFYCTVVVPHRHCPKCGLNSYGETHDDAQARLAQRKANATRPAA